MTSEKQHVPFDETKSWDRGRAYESVRKYQAHGINSSVYTTGQTVRKLACETMAQAERENGTTQTGREGGERTSPLARPGNERCARYYLKYELRRCSL